MTAIDRWVYVAIIIGPLFTIPQVYSIWIEHTKGVSLITWASYLAASVIWLIYGLKRKDMAIIIVEVIWIILSVLILVGLASY